MKPLNRLGAAAALAGTLAVTLVAASPAAASTIHRPLVVATITVGDICTGLADYIQFLEGALHPGYGTSCSHRRSDCLRSCADREPARRS
jgi:hypothetical protein